MKWIFKQNTGAIRTTILFCLIFVAVDVLANGIKEYAGGDLVQPFEVTVSVPNGTAIVVEARQQRGDVVLELEEPISHKLIKRVDFPIEYPFDEIMLITKKECDETCILRVSAKNQIDSALPFKVDIQKIGLDEPVILKIRGLSKTAQMAADNPESPDVDKSDQVALIIDMLEKAQINPSGNNNRYHALILMRLAESYKLVDNTKDRKLALERLKKDFENNNLIYSAYANYELGDIEVNQTQEEKLYVEGIELSTQLGDSISRAIGLNYLATSKIQQGNFEQAIELLLDAAKTLEDKGSIFWLSYPLNNLSWANYRLGNLDTALKYATQLKLIADKYQDNENKYWSLYNLGFIYQQKGELTIALDFMDEALKAINTFNSQRINNPFTTLKILLLRQKSILLQDQGAYLEALDNVKLLKQVVSSSSQPKRLPDVLYLESEINLNLGESENAKKLLQSAIELSESSDRKIFIAKCLRKMAEITFEDKDLELALNYLRRAINLLKGTNDQKALTRLLIYTLDALVAAGGEHQAAELLVKVEIMVRNNGVGLDLIQFGKSKAKILSKLKKFTAAQSSLENTLEEVNRLLSSVKRKDLRRSYISLQKNLYEMLIWISTQVYPNDPERSLLIAEEFKGLTIEEELQNLRNNQHVNEEILKKRQDLHEQLKLISKSRATKNNSAFFEKVRRLSSELEAIEVKINWGEAKKIQRFTLEKIPSITDGRTILYYFLGLENSWCWIIDDNGLEIVELPAENIIQAEVEQLIAVHSIPPALRSDSNLWEDKQNAIQLSNTLLREVFIRMASRRKKPEGIMIVADGVLTNVPFAQLLSPKTGRFLIEQHSISYAFSIGSWQALEQRENEFSRTDQLTLVSSSSPLKVGNIDLPKLEYTDDEISKIASLFGNSSFIVNDLENENNRFMHSISQPADILHFATHIYLDPEFPHLSFILLPENIDEQRIWLSPQISSYNLPVRTVILSGCDSAIGKIDAGEGMLSIGRAFIEAGATNVIGSIRKVDDQASTILMGYLYENIKEGLPLVKSLQIAQVKMFSNHPEYLDPYFWAGYQLIGAGSLKKKVGVNSTLTHN